MTELSIELLFCSRCGHAVSVEIDRLSQREDTAFVSMWSCPACYGLNFIRVDGMIVSVRPGHDSP